jgi:hypothetical protein
MLRDARTFAKSSRVRKRDCRLLLLAILIFVAAGVGDFGCKNEGTSPRETRASDAIATEQTALEQVLNHDLALDRVMQDVDRAIANKDTARALAILETRALEAANATLKAARACTLVSPWGRANRDALVALASDRKSELPRYAKALKAGDLAATLDATQVQLALQRRAIDVAATIAQGPGASSERAL